MHFLGGGEGGPSYILNFPISSFFFGFCLCVFGVLSVSFVVVVVFMFFMEITWFKLLLPPNKPKKQNKTKT